MTLKCKKAKEGLYPVDALRAAIVEQAIEDWKEMCKQKCGEGEPLHLNYEGSPVTTFDTLRDFFRSQWCELLLFGNRLDGETILEMLEDMREATLYGTSINTWQKENA